MATVSAIVGVVGAVTQQRQARRAERRQEQARRVENVRANVARQRSIRQRIAQARALRAQQQAAGFTAGAPGASGVAGALGGIQTDVASNIGFAQSQFGLQQQAAQLGGQAAGFQNQAAQTGLFTSAATGLINTFNPNTVAGNQNVAAIRNLFAG